MGRPRPQGPRVPEQAHGRDPEAVGEYEEALTTLLMRQGLPAMMARVLTCLSPPTRAASPRPRSSSTSGSARRRSPRRSRFSRARASSAADVTSGRSEQGGWTRGVGASGGLPGGAAGTRARIEQGRSWSVGRSRTQRDRPPTLFQQVEGRFKWSPRGCPRQDSNLRSASGGRPTTWSTTPSEALIGPRHRCACHPSTAVACSSLHGPFHAEIAIGSTRGLRARRSRRSR
jgi:hypothetical protein